LLRNYYLIIEYLYVIQLRGESVVLKILGTVSRASTIVAVLVIALIVLTQPSLAGFKVERAIIDEDVTPGVPLKEKISIYNVGTNRDLNVEINVFGLGQSLDGSIKLLKADDDTGPYSARNYIALSDNKITLKPEWDDEVDVDAEMPEDMGDGSRYAVIQFKIPVEDGTKGTLRDWGVLVPVLLTNSNSKLIKTGEIAEMSVDWPNATVLFTNSGNTHFKPIIQATIKDSAGQIVKEISTTTTISIIPGCSRRYPIDFSSKDELKPGDYSLEVLASLDDSTILDSKEMEFEIKAV
jgi:hypothetical protein